MPPSSPTRAARPARGRWSPAPAPGPTAWPRAAGAPADPRIVPFRGGYLRLRPERDALVRANIYPVPDPELPFLGAHLTRGPDGTRAARPDGADGRRARRLPSLGECARRPARDAGLAGHPAPDRPALACRRRRELLHAASRRAYVRAARRLVPELRAADFVAGPAGIRAQAVAADGTLVDDFVGLARSAPAVFVRNAPSPAATSSLPLARLIADEAAPCCAGTLPIADNPGRVGDRNQPGAISPSTATESPSPAWISPATGRRCCFLHGLAGYAGEWRMTAEWLAGGRRVVALDGRGHGRSERRPDDVSIAAHAADAAHVDRASSSSTGRSSSASRWAA